MEHQVLRLTLERVARDVGPPRTIGVAVIGRHGNSHVAACWDDRRGRAVGRTVHEPDGGAWSLVSAALRACTDEGNDLDDDTLRMLERDLNATRSRSLGDDPVRALGELVRMADPLVDGRYCRWCGGATDDERYGRLRRLRLLTEDLRRSLVRVPEGATRTRSWWHEPDCPWLLAVAAISDDANPRDASCLLPDHREGRGQE